MLSVKQGVIKYHLLSLWYDMTWDWTQVSWAISKQIVYNCDKNMIIIIIIIIIIIDKCLTKNDFNWILKI